MTLSLKETAYIVGGVLVLLNLWPLVRPCSCREWVGAFPRSVWPARVLAAVDLAWVAWVILHAALGRFEFLKPYVYIAAPIVYLLVIFMLDELLAARAFGGFLLLVANPMLNAARWHESPARFVVTVLAYAWVVIGITLMLSPYRFRKSTAWWIAGNRKCRLAGALGVLLGVVLIVLGLVFY